MTSGRAGTRLGIVTGLLAEARVAMPLGRVEHGEPLAAAERLAAAGVSYLLSFGLAGGLDPAIGAGTMLVPRSILSSGERYAVDAAPAARLGDGNPDPLLDTPRIVSRREEKIRLYDATGAASCDMESGAVARVAARHGLPFAVLRVVCDPASRSLPPAALVALDQRGAIGLWRVLASLAREPGQLASLLALARDAARARAALVRRVHEIGVRGGLVL